MLKQIEVIGSRGRNWPIRDAKEQSRLIKSAILSTPVVNPPTSFPPLSANTEKNTEQLDRPPSPGKRRIKDPYAADSLFDLLSPGKDRNESLPTPRAPATAQPPPRDLGDLFVSHDDSPDVSPSRKPIAPRAGAEKHFQPSRIFSDNDDAPDGTPSGKSVAPKAGASKNYLPSRIFGEDEDTPDAASPGKSVAPKAGAGKNYLPSRIFDDDETVAAEGNQKPVYRAHPNRYSHFEFGTDTSPREPKPIPARPKSQHMAQWNFEDFVTPEKPARKPRGQEVRHFGWSDDEGDVETPPPRPKVPQPRRDAESHIQLTDEIDTQKDARMISSYGNKGLSLYKNPLYNDEDEAENETDNNNNNKAPLSVVANGVNRKKDFDSHWSMADPTPDADANIENKKPVTSDRMKAIKMMEPSWDTYDESPQSDKVAPPPRRAARSAIDRSWDLGDM